MYTPVILSAVLGDGRHRGFLQPSRGANRSPLGLVVTLVDAGVGFYFHVRGIQRKPGGWRLPMTNMIMGPPIFAPLLFGTSAYLGLIASYPAARRRKALPRRCSEDTIARSRLLARAARAANCISAEQDIREGKFPAPGAIVAGVSALLSGFEAFYSHYKNNFRYKVQWSPVILAPAARRRGVCLR